MTPTEVTDAARRATNTYGSNFVTDTELLTYLSMALAEASHHARVYESVDVYTAVASQATYTITASAFEIKQITWGGDKIKPVTFREAEALQSTLIESSTAGTPAYYYRWSNDLVVIPAPASSGDQIHIYSYATHPQVNASSVILAPDTLHGYFIDYVAFRILQKENNDNAGNYLQLWKSNLEVMRREMIQRNRSDAFRIVQTEENLVYNTLGLV